MEILFDDDDLEPMGGVPQKSTSPEPLSSEASLFGDLEESLGLEPVFAPAPVQKTKPSSETWLRNQASARPPVSDPWARARKEEVSREAAPTSSRSKSPQKVDEPPAYLDCPPVYPEEALFAPEEIPEPIECMNPFESSRVTKTSRRSKSRASFMREEEPSEKIIRTPDRADAFTVIRDDGTVLEVNRDTCADPEVFSRERENRRRRRTSWSHQGGSEGFEGTEGETNEAFQVGATKRTKPKKNLLTRAIDALSRREYSRKDLERKLSVKLEDGETRETLDEALNRLESLGLLSDERFAEAQVRASAGRMGDYRLRRTLRQSGVSEELINAALETVEEPEEVRALRIWRRRWSEPPKDWKEREKMTRFLMTRGFGMSAIQKVLRGDVELPEDSY